MWKQRQIKNWEKIRAKGRDRFVRNYGVLSWGVPTAIAWAIGVASREGWDRLPILIAIGLVIFPLAGIWVGRVMWNANEKRFAKQTARP